MAQMELDAQYVVEENPKHSMHSDH
jgi:hypothetical protein